MAHAERVRLARGYPPDTHAKAAKRLKGEIDCLLQPGREQERMCVTRVRTHHKPSTRFHGRQSIHPADRQQALLDGSLLHKVFGWKLESGRLPHALCTNRFRNPGLPPRLQWPCNQSDVMCMQMSLKAITVILNLTPS